ncbi:glycosyltransferase family 22 protein [Curvularia clavata]|uniref:Mannosyltransferase n=1 Tax=Curvularia clavata TaxID=95742 RepID=A0A9Q9DQP3_CURCL|nr:glycosyltransferase family 22 protein [Curvularia clavata]
MKASLDAARLLSNHRESPNPVRLSPSIFCTRHNRRPIHDTLAALCIAPSPTSLPGTPSFPGHRPPHLPSFRSPALRFARHASDCPMPSTTDSAPDTNPSGPRAPPQTLPTSYRDSLPPLFPLLLAFRLANALTLRTFFQPDEFFQSLEPAWHLAFGPASNAWITWEWTTQLRSSLHPALFAAVYRVAARVAQAGGLSLPAKAKVLLVAPKVTQAVSAALLDCYTWNLAGKVYGRGTRPALAASADQYGTDGTSCAVILASLVSDRLYYGVWTIPPVRFLYFNIAQSLAVFYGKNRADYYFTEGLPLLLTTALPFAMVGLWQSLQARDEPAVGQRILTRLSWTSIAMTVTLSLISHKEVRFLYPILPFLHIIAARPLSQFLPAQAATWRRATVLFLLVANVLLAGYASQVHQRGVIDVLAYIRHKHETRNALSTMSRSTHTTTITTNTTAAFLMPCHSTPWRSHLVYPEITAWALTCEPPIHVPLAERSTYLDEADEFYIHPGPVGWLKANMEDVDTVRNTGSRSSQHWMRQDPKFKRKYRRQWPQHLVFFEQLEETLQEHLSGSRYKECWRGFNSHFHDDRRRVGDVIVWCLDGV